MQKVLIIIATSLLGIFLFIPKAVLANSETIQSFDSQITTHQDGTFNVTETIIYDFGTNSKHGVFRDIPTVTKVGELYRQSKINVTAVKRDSNNENYSISDNNNQKISIKIGSPNRTISGSHTYLISYLVENGIGSNYADHDEIYWNITGNGWQVPILSASASITTDFGVLPNKAACFTGTEGSTQKNCTIPPNFPNSPITLTVPLSPSEGLTVAVSFPVNTFPKSVLSKAPPAGNQTSGSKLAWIGTLYLGAAAVLNFILAPGLLIWYLTKKRKKRFGPVGVNFDIPKDWMGKRITPAEVGTIDNTKLERNDIVATIFDLAIRKYIKIKQVKKEKTLGIFDNGDDYEITKLQNYDDLEPFEKVLLSRLFENGDAVIISSLKLDFYETFKDMDNEVFKSLVAKMYYTKNPKTQKGLLVFAGIASLFLLGPLLSIVLIFLAFKLNGRTTKGDEIDFKIDGLKLFLKNMSREYKWQADNLYIVEKYIPYAMALGYIDEFMKQLKIIYPSYQPTWYTGYARFAFYTASGDMIRSFDSGFTSVAPSSSSGFSSGGGFSGGGGSGGGGGSW